MASVEEREAKLIESFAPKAINKARTLFERYQTLTDMQIEIEWEDSDINFGAVMIKCKEIPNGEFIDQIHIPINTSAPRVREHFVCEGILQKVQDYCAQNNPQKKQIEALTAEVAKLNEKVDLMHKYIVAIHDMIASGKQIEDKTILDNDDLD